eukprot:CAMPEP_0171939990 /NCGR_PEP_ID=MMETSP0993-20121228/36715_1 /TAXON_ID=483369 /ORGANISM="non described non described, Strain CCMP2098" /LENGTH=174 /DNA_ID=CAMNT_0012581927 /DNA_START=169 /DNA_END=693 /DNA_ORIENTATION=+
MFTSFHTRTLPSSTRLPYLQAEVAKNGFAVNKFLDDEACSCKHCKTSITELFRLHRAELTSNGGFPAQGVEAKVARVVVLTQGEERSSPRLHPPFVRAEGLAEIDEEEEREGDGGSSISEHVDSNGGVVEPVTDCRGVLSHKKADNGHHADAPVHDLGLAKALHRSQVRVLGEP